MVNPCTFDWFAMVKVENEGGAVDHPSPTTRSRDDSRHVRLPVKLFGNPWCANTRRDETITSSFVQLSASFIVWILGLMDPWGQLLGRRLPIQVGKILFCARVLHVCGVRWCGKIGQTEHCVSVAPLCPRSLGLLLGGGAALLALLLASVTCARACRLTA